MEIKLQLKEDYEVVKLYQILRTKRNLYENENHKHIDMIRLLEGNENNEAAKGRLKNEKARLIWNNEEIEFIDNLMEQLESIVDNVLGIMRREE